MVPDKLKLAKVIPVYKNKGEITSPGNYRPISLLSVFAKLLEKVMYFRLYNHLQTNGVLNQYQFGFGFRRTYSTTLALIEVIDKIYQNQNEGKLCAGVYLIRSRLWRFINLLTYLDLQKAFDTVNHILLHKLYNYGVRDVVHDWFRNYLTNRQQFTCMLEFNRLLPYSCFLWCSTRFSA